MTGVKVYPTTVANVKHHQGPAIYVGRPSSWGNPYSHRPSILAKFSVGTLAEAIDSYAAWIQMPAREKLRGLIPSLRGRVLTCWCAPKPCHAHILPALADGEKWDRYLPFGWRLP